MGTYDVRRDSRNIRDVRDARDFRNGRDVRDELDSRDGCRGKSESQSRSSSLPLSDSNEIQFNMPDLYEVKSSEGPWYPATIRRLKRNGRYEADLFGGGCFVFYPSVKLREIRLRERWGGGPFRDDRDNNIRGDSRTRDNGWFCEGRPRGFSRGRSRGRMWKQTRQ